MLYGTTPFKGQNRHATFANVLRQEPHFPDYPAVSTMGKSCVKKLLCKNEHKRLGSQTGASEVKHHKWFATLNWGLLRNSKPPITPAASVSFLHCLRHSAHLCTQNGIDTINFRAIRDSKSIDWDDQIRAVAGSPNAHTPGGHEADGNENPFSEFSSVTRHHVEDC